MKYVVGTTRVLGSVRLGTAEFDHLAPLLDFPGEELSRFGRRHSERHAAPNRQAASFRIRFRNARSTTTSTLPLKYGILARPVGSSQTKLHRCQCARKGARCLLLTGCRRAATFC